MYSEIKYLVCGEAAVVIEFGDEISTEINAQIRKLIEEIEKQNWKGIVEMIPTYRSLLVQYDPLEWSFDSLVGKLRQLHTHSDSASSESEEITLIEIPTVYGGEYGPDIGFVAEHAKLSEQEVIHRHAGRDYLVYMMGFIPGFTYLGGMDPALETPRLTTPRVKILPGSVGIAGMQTGIYPSASPGGWQIIGRTPVQLYNSAANPPVFIHSGDYIRYVPITMQAYEDIEKQVQENRYEVTVRKMKRGEIRCAAM